MAPKFNHTEEQMKKAIKAVQDGMSQRKAAQLFKVPRITLLDKIKGRSPYDRRMGHMPYLSSQEENDIVE